LTVIEMMQDPLKFSVAIGVLFAAIVVVGLTIVHLSEPESPQIVTQSRQ
jgi:hypothetical protein